MDVVRQRFTEIDVLMLSVWTAFSLVYALTPNHNEFLFWVLMGGAVFIACHMYSVVYRGFPSQGYLQLAALTPVFLMVSNAVNHYVNTVTPVTYDAVLLKYDLGISAAVRRWSFSPWIMRPIDLVYDAIPLFMVAGIVILRGRRRKALLTTIVVGSLIAPFLCYLCPAVGPAHVGDPYAPRNCMPSMHMTWTLLPCVYSTDTWRLVFGTIAFLTAWATLATGEHYALDLVGAIGFTWCLVVLVNHGLREAADVQA